MNKNNFCCNEMEKAIHDTYIINYPPSNTYQIHSEQDFRYDGDERWDDMSGAIDIKYCPFCGKELPKQTE